MRKSITAITALLVAGSLLPMAHATTTHKAAGSTHKASTGSLHHASVATQSNHSAHSGKKSKSRKLRGQQEIAPERVTQIQQALINAHYLTGEADGNWDAHSIAAMQKFQADNNWQTKLMPDARALVKLGLGPDYSTAINAKESNFTSPTKTSAPVTQESGFVSASGISR